MASESESGGELPLADAAATRRLGRALGTCVGCGDLISLVGDFGAGKTTLTQGLALGLGVDPKTRVVSPTFVLLCVYAGRMTLFHYDLQRLPKATELYDLDWDTASQGVAVVEWGDRADGFKGCSHLELQLTPAAGGGRTARFVAHGPRPKALLDMALQEYARIVHTESGGAVNLPENDSFR